MKKHLVRIASAFLAMAAFAIITRGQAVDKLIVNIPHEFVVAGTILPAGTYTINRADERDARILVIRSFENHASIFFVPIEAASNNGAERGVTFRQVGDQRLLSRIETADHVFTLPLSSSEALVAAKKDHGNPSAGVSGSGSN